MLKKGFTLIELIIVIGIIALLATTVILVINPVKIFKEARDSQRIADLGQTSQAISLYLATADITDPKTALGPTCSANCWVHDGPSIGTDTDADGCKGGGAAARHGTTSATKEGISKTTQTVDGNGWVPVNLAATSGGAAIAAYPKDPKKTGAGVNATYFYSYACNDSATTFELNANMESARYAKDGSDDVESRDGGTLDDIFEVGTALNL